MRWRSAFAKSRLSAGICPSRAAEAGRVEGYRGKPEQPVDQRLLDVHALHAVELDVEMGFPEHALADSQAFVVEGESKEPVAQDRRHDE